MRWAADTYFETPSKLISGAKPQLNDFDSLIGCGTQNNGRYPISIRRCRQAALYLNGKDYKIHTYGYKMFRKHTRLLSITVST